VRPKILVVDDEPANLELLVRALRRRYDVVTARSGAEALELLRGESFAAILSDQRMPQMTGTEFLARARQLVPDTVRMILTGYAPEKESLDAINLAHVATFLTKPIAPDAVERAIADAVELHELARKNRALAEELGRTTRDLEETRRLLLMSVDDRSRELVETNRRLEAVARHDALTGICNRPTFEERLAAEVQRLERYGGVVSLVLSSVDGLRAWNEEHGSAAGDRLLVDIARLLSGGELGAALRTRPPDLAARWSGAGFALMLPGTGKAGAAALCARIRQALSATAPVTLSHGIAEAPGDARTPAGLVSAASRCLARAREGGGDRVVHD
jgi:diguanylate cyclase (GGDEF)-like protein